MRVALVSPYSWTYPGGVTRHIEALATELLASGHDVRVMAPFDPDVRRTAVLHRGARPQVRPLPEWLVPLGPTIGWPSNGAVSNLAHTPHAVATLRRELAAGGFDVVHLHEPVAPVVGWDSLTSTDAPLVGTFHCYSESTPPHAIAALLGARRKLNHLSARIAVSEAAAWTGRRFYGGSYRVIPNGVALPEGGRLAGSHARARGPAADRLRRPGRRAQGPARAAARLRGAAAPGAGRADDRRRGGAGARADAARPRGGDGARPRRRRREARRAGGCRRAVRAVAGRRVVRDGPDRGVRGRHAGRRLRHRGLSRRGRRRPRRAARATRRRHAAGGDAARPGAGPGAQPRAGRGGRPQRGALRLAAGRRGGGLGLRGRRGGRATRGHDGARRGAGRRARDGRRAGARAPHALAGAAPAGHGAPGRQAAAARPVRGSGAGRRRRRGAGAEPDRDAADRRGAARLQPDLGAGRARPDVPVDVPARDLLARDPEGGAPRCAAALRRRDAGHLDRRADVGDAARPARGAVARADRRAKARPGARPAAGRARHGRLADAAQRARAGDPRRS